MRKLNSKNIEEKFILLYFDWIMNSFIEIKKFTSLRSIGIYLDINYNIITQINSGKSICYSKFIKIIKI